MQTPHQDRYVEDIFRGDVHLEEVLSMIPTDLVKEQFNKYEYENNLKRFFRNIRRNVKS